MTEREGIVCPECRGHRVQTDGAAGTMCKTCSGDGFVSQETWMKYVVGKAVAPLRAAIDALKAQAAPTPVEDEVTEAMARVGLTAFYGYDRHADVGMESMKDAYRAMRATAPVPASTPVEDEVTEAMIDAGARQLAGVAADGLARLLARDVYEAMRAARVPAPTPEPSAELAALHRDNAWWQEREKALLAQVEEVNEGRHAANRELADWRARYDAEHARAERLAAVARMVRAFADPKIAVRWERVEDAMAALHPGDTEAQ